MLALSHVARRTLHLRLHGQSNVLCSRVDRLALDQVPRQPQIHPRYQQVLLSDGLGRTVRASLGQQLVHSMLLRAKEPTDARLGPELAAVVPLVEGQATTQHAEGPLVLYGAVA